MLLWKGTGSTDDKATYLMVICYFSKFNIPTVLVNFKVLCKNKVIGELIMYIFSLTFYMIFYSLFVSTGYYVSLFQ